MHTPASHQPNIVNCVVQPVRPWGDHPQGLLFCLTLLFAGMLMGCSKGVPEFAKDLVAVSGTVTMDSKPLEGAMVTYIAQDGPSRSSTAMTDASGQYSMTTPTAGEGILPGAYTVIISKLLMPDGSPIPPDTAPMDVGAEELLPEKYSSVAAPTLSAEVGKLGGKFDFELTAM